MTIVIELKYEIGQVVYLITDKDQLERIVFSALWDGSCVMYRLACGTETSQHYEFEITAEKKILV